MRRKLSEFKERLDVLANFKSTKNHKNVAHEVIESLLKTEIGLLKKTDEALGKSEEAHQAQNDKPSKSLSEYLLKEKRKTSSGGSTLDDVCDVDPQKHKVEPESVTSIFLFHENHGLQYPQTDSKLDQGLSDLLSSSDFPLALRQNAGQDSQRSMHFEDLMADNWDCCHRDHQSLFSRDGSRQTSADKSLGMDAFLYEDYG